MPSVAGSNVPDVSTSPAASSSITAVGGTRPPAPITVAGGNGFPDEITWIDVGLISSVLLRLLAPPTRTSATVPVSPTESPTATVGAAAVATEHPSEVAGSASGTGSWMKNPLGNTAVTVP